MRFLGFFTIIIASMFLFACCAGNKAKKEMASENNKKLENKEDISKKLVGTWVNAKGNFWIEFHDNNTYDMGRGDSATKVSRMWAVDENTSVISLTTKKGVRYCNYHFEGEYLIMQMGKKEKNHKFHKVAVRPEMKK
jgi:hypothetical protein